MKRMLSIIAAGMFLASVFSQEKPASGCSVVTFSKDGKVFFAGNDDYINPDSYYWVEKGIPGRHGVIWIGTRDNPQQGINEKYLAYDASGLPRVDVNPHAERAPVAGEYYHEYVMQIMHECSSVKEVIAWIGSHQRFPYMHDQLHFADKSGDAVIVSAGQDGEIVFTRNSPGNSFLVSTNYNIANPSNAYDYPCWRYDRANELLEQLVNKGETASVPDVVAVMDAIHQEASSWTLETLVADLTDGVMYLYYFHQYDSPVTINVLEELANPRQEGPLSKLFPVNVQEEAAIRYLKLTRDIRFNKILGRSWAALLIISLALLFLLPERGKSLRLWIPAVLVLGPLALILRMIVLKTGDHSRVGTALTETAGDLVPVSVAYIVAQVMLVLYAVTGKLNQQQQLLLILSLPLLSSWLLFHGPLLSLAGRKSFMKFLFQRFPHVLVTSFLGLAGIFPVAMPLVNETISMSMVIPLSPWIVLSWWAIIAGGSLLGGIFIYIYEFLVVARGYSAWNIFAGNDGEISTPGWGKNWWCLLISLVLLVAGLIGGVLLIRLTTGT